MKAVGLERIAKKLTSQEIRTLSYSGKILVFPTKHFPILNLIRDEAEQLVKSNFGDHPELCHLEKPDHLAINCMNLRKEFRMSAAPTKIKKALESIGFDLGNEKVYGGMLDLRVAPGGDSQIGTDKVGSFGRLPPHRDTWASNVSCQLNWWMPLLFEPTEQSTLAFYPDFFNRNVENDSIDWNYLKVISKEETRQQPTATATSMNDLGEARLLLNVEPGDLVCFSGAHLHSSYTMKNEISRFNVVTRTVAHQDYIKGIGASYLDDHHAAYRPLKWWREIDVANDRWAIGDFLGKNEKIR